MFQQQTNGHFVAVASFAGAWQDATRKWGVSSSQLQGMLPCHKLPSARRLREPFAFSLLHHSDDDGFLSSVGSLAAGHHSDYSLIRKKERKSSHLWKKAFIYYAFMVH
jgi:hypothetical protein